MGVCFMEKPQNTPDREMNSLKISHAAIALLCTYCHSHHSLNQWSSKSAGLLNLTVPVNIISG